MCLLQTDVNVSFLTQRKKEVEKDKRRKQALRNVLVPIHKCLRPTELLKFTGLGKIFILAGNMNYY